MDVTMLFNIGACVVGLLFSVFVIRSNFLEKHPWLAQLVVGIVVIITTTLLCLLYVNDL